MNYIEVDFILEPLLPAREVLVAELADAGFESFVETEEGVKAYIREDLYSDSLLADLLTLQMPDLMISYAKSVIEDQNWNAEWEKNFEPIIVENQCIIRAPFHEDRPEFPYQLIIEPKMSFGTGHHATTYLIVAEMLDMDIKAKKVLDMGSGTGVLAIMAEKKGAESADAIDIDEWAFENSNENVERNKCHRIRVIIGGSEAIPENAQYDVVLANINRNILTRDMHEYVKVMKNGSEILFSGFFVTDKNDIDAVAKPLGLELISERSRGEWCMLRYRMI